MSGGRLVVLDRSGRAGKAFPLGGGACTLGRGAACDIRVLLPTVRDHHATVAVHANQTVVRNVSDGETLVNGRSVSVAALRHNDVITIGDRSLRWEYDDPHAKRPLEPQPALYRGARPARAPRRATTPGGAAALHRTLEMHHRASMPGNAGGKQVAIVQPQRRDTSEQIDSSVRQSPNSPRSPNQRGRGSRNDTQELNVSESDSDRTRSPRFSPKSLSLQNTTKATLWIESRKSSPRKSAKATPPPPPPPPRRAASAKKATPLRMAVLRKAQSAHKMKVTKIQAPLKVDHMKQQALMLMTGRTPNKSKLVAAAPGRARRAPAAPRLVLARRSPAPRAARTTARGSAGKSVSVLEITDSDGRDSMTTVQSDTSRRSKVSTLGSPLLPSPRKSALKDPSAKRTSRKTESIKFDLSNLENRSQDDSNILMVSDTTRTSRGADSMSSHEADSEDDLTLHYSESSSIQSPSPRRSIHSSRSSKMLATVGSPLKEPRQSDRRSLTPESPRARKSMRGSIILQKALDTTGDNSRYSRRTTKTLTDQSWDSTVESAFRTRTLSPRSPARNLESYSVVDLVSIDSNESAKSPSVYDSVGSTRSSSILFGTPQTSGRKTRSTIDANLLSSSTPYVGRGRSSTRSNSSPNISTRKSSPNKSARRTTTSRRSKSLTTPENSEETQKHISINSTRISRANKSRSRLNDSELQFIDLGGDSEESPRTSRRSTTVNKSQIQQTPSPKSSPRITPSLKSPSPQKTISPKSPTSGKSSKSVSTRKTISLKSPSPRKTTSPRSASASPRHTISPKPTSPNKTSSSNRSSGRNTSTPKSSPLKRASSKGTSPQSKRGSRARLTLDVTQSSGTDSEGIVTPENTTSPPEAGTPVLSIQSLLDSSQSSFTSQRSPKKTRASVNIKRKTIGAIRSARKQTSSGIKSKSFTTSVRKSLRSLRLSRESDKNADSTQTDEETVTPKSAVKLVQEAVKNKHSTAKKPQSKRSIIDNLNDSDIVKQLFNSPVKRKLSQSMTEFSRKKLFDDDDVVRRPTRNTVALSGRTPDISLLEHTERFTPEHFVSPLSTPGNSPNLSGIKRLYKKNTPDNDLRNVKGVKKLLRTPRARKSVRNDLTNVSGIKAVFAKSPKNRLSDVRVKEVFAASPRNDLRRVTGVKSLFQAQKTQNSPKNDLTDVRGVRNLFKRKSAANDLRNVSGVKKTLRIRSPKNDLTDVRGVKQMFRQEKNRDDYHNVSGIEELFNESNTSHRDSEALFDQLVGKPPIKAVYSKSFLNKSTKKPSKSRAAKSLHTSIDLITNNVEEWLDKELQKHLHKNKQLDSSKGNVTRELQKLMTETVAGSAPLRTSRVRSSTMMQSAVEAADRKSASQVYSAHTLPIKKRSFVEASLEKSNNETRANKSNNLPIKKRAVIHSTPVKGRYNVTMNASELGRVSPIIFEKTQNVDTDTANRTKQQIKSPKQKAKRATRTTVVQVSKAANEKSLQKSPAPKDRRNTKAKPATDSQTVSNTTQSPKQVRATRSKNDDKREVPAKTTRAMKSTKSSPKQVNVSKSPPKPTGRKTKASAVTEKETSASKPVSPKTTRRGKSSAVAETVAPITTATKSRRTRQNTEKQEVTIVSKNSPKGKATRGTKAKPVAETTQSPAKPKPSPKSESQSPVKSKRNLRNRTDTTEVTNTKKSSKSLVITKKPPVMSPQPAAKTTRNRSQKTSTLADSPKKTAATRKKAAPAQDKPATPKTTRAKLVVIKPTPKMKPQKAKTASRSGTESDKSKKESPKKSLKTTRGRKQVVVKSPPRKESRKAANKSVEPETVQAVKRGRRVEKLEEVEPPAKRGRSDKTSKAQKQESPKKGRGTSASKASIQAPTRSNRRTKAETTAAPEPPKSRKRKSNEQQSTVPAKVAKVENAKTTRGKKAVAEAAEPTKGKQKKPVKESKNDTTKGKKNESKGKKDDKKDVSKTNDKKQDNKDVSRSKRQVKGDTGKPAKAQKPTKATKEPVKKKAQSESDKKPVEKKTTRGQKAAGSGPAAASTARRTAKPATSPAKAVKSTRSRRR